MKFLNAYIFPELENMQISTGDREYFPRQNLRINDGSIEQKLSRAVNSVLSLRTSYNSLSIEYNLCYAGDNNIRGEYTGFTEEVLILDLSENEDNSVIAGVTVTYTRDDTRARERMIPSTVEIYHKRNIKLKVFEQRYISTAAELSPPDLAKIATAVIILLRAAGKRACRSG